MTTDFYAAPPAEQRYHLTQLAREALTAWDIVPDALTLIYDGNNTVFRVQSGQETFALKIHRPDGPPKAHILAERGWLRHIHAQTDLLAPVPVRDLFTGQLTGADGPVYVLLYRWLDGESVPVADTTVQQVQRIGTYLAQLHAMHPPEPLGQLAERPTLDYEGLFGARSPYASQHETEFITPAQQETLSAVAERVREVMQNQADDQFGFIHGDFIYKNTLITPAGDVAAIDYENSGFGYYLYDLACPLLFYKPLPNYTALKNALWTGYTDRRPLADAARDNLEGFVAGRYVASCRWVAAHANHPTIDGRAPEIIAERVDELRNFLQTGAL